MDMTQTLDALFAKATLLPVINVERETDILPLADALAAGGITTLEITLRTALGLPAIALLRRERQDRELPSRQLKAASATRRNELYQRPAARKVAPSPRNLDS